jgi:hypothetical protein
MANKNKALGTKWESDVAIYLRSYGFDVWRLAQTGAEDQGDLAGSGPLRDWAFECRNRKDLSLAKNVDDANDRARCKGSRFGVTIMKRRGRSVHQGYVAMDLGTFTELLMHAYGMDDDGFCPS